ncbi:hypothetical protein Tco_0287564 [Tanacetum coccineum]
MEIFTHSQLLALSLPTETLSSLASAIGDLTSIASLSSNDTSYSSHSYASAMRPLFLTIKVLEAEALELRRARLALTLLYLASKSLVFQVLMTASCIFFIIRTILKVLDNEVEKKAVDRGVAKKIYFPLSFWLPLTSYHGDKRAIFDDVFKLRYEPKAHRKFSMNDALKVFTSAKDDPSKKLHAKKEGPHVHTYKSSVPTSNPYDVLNDLESEDEAEVVYDEVVNLKSKRTGASPPMAPDGSKTLFILFVPCWHFSLVLLCSR